jgi:hypothetical protein
MEMKAKKEEEKKRGEKKRQHGFLCRLDSSEKVSLPKMAAV